MSTTALVLPVLELPARPAARRRARRCATARPARPVRPVRTARPVRSAAPLRLTRRGRLAVTCTAATLLTSAVVAVTGALAGASAEAGRAPVPTTVTVMPGQTLSQIAGEWAPSEDWREVAGAIVQLNALPSMTVQAGQQLTMPARG